jgi:hypothetical protein
MSRITVTNGTETAYNVVPYAVQGGTIGGTQPTFNGAPLFTAAYTLVGRICHFRIDVDMDNITSFGTGQYYLTLPFQSKFDYLLSDGCLHDISTNDQYAVLGHVLAGSNVLTLLSIAPNGRQVHFTNSVPVNLSTADNFHVAGTFIIND